MKNLNALVEEGKNKFREDFCDEDGIILVSETGLEDIEYINNFLSDFARKVAETALKECRPSSVDAPRTEWAKGYARCLSDYDERVKSFLQ